MTRNYSPVHMMDAIEDMARNSRQLQVLAAQQQHRYFILVRAMVALQQSMRDDKNYAVSDAIRSALTAAGIRISSGTGSCSYDLIPPELAGRPVGDTWEDGSK